MGKNLKFQNARKKGSSSEDEDEEEWIESGDSLDDIVINEVTDQETDDIIFQVEDLKVGDYILALFVSTGKRAVVHYKYVAKILHVLEGDDFEVQCLKSLDETKTTFKFIENDQCVITKKEILGRLPDPQLLQFGRILKTVFPAEVEVSQDSEASYTPNALQILIISMDETLLRDSQSNLQVTVPQNKREKTPKRAKFNVKVSTQAHTTSGTLMKYLSEEEKTKKTEVKDELDFFLKALKLL
ncbi:hypothetical protein FQA39_LY12592 [Lamprigera yunnana]|nr:hypothetical protein FQA39_LY12592 [Lamprigera yunnana]